MTGDKNINSGICPSHARLTGMNTTLHITSSLWRRIIGLPSTRLGRWSVGLAITFFVLFPLWIFYAMYLRPIPRPTFFSDPLHAILLLSAAAAAIAGGIAGAFAFVVGRERSFAVILSILIGAFVIYWTIGELVGG
jgi:hypothetical protein